MLPAYRHQTRDDGKERTIIAYLCIYFIYYGLEQKAQKKNSNSEKQKWKQTTTQDC